ncbi:hypothetical protein ACFQEX_12570 [Roseibium salinum]
MMLLSAPFFYVLDGSIAKDLGLRSQTLSPALIATSDRKCKSWVFLFHHCSYDYEIGPEKHNQDYIFVALGAPDSIMLLKNAATGAITSDVGQDHLFNRIATLVIFPLIGVFLLVKMLGRRAGPVPAGLPEARTPETPRQTAAAAPPGRPGNKVFGKRR